MWNICAIAWPEWIVKIGKILVTFAVYVFHLCVRVSSLVDVCCCTSLRPTFSYIFLRISIGIFIWKLTIHQKTLKKVCILRDASLRCVALQLPIQLFIAVKSVLISCTHYGHISCAVKATFRFIYRFVLGISFRGKMLFQLSFAFRFLFVCLFVCK